jgi:hypothetical protein
MISINFAIAKIPITIPIPNGANTPTPAIIPAKSKDNAARIKALIAERIGL